MEDNQSDISRSQDEDYVFMPRDLDYEDDDLSKLFDSDVGSEELPDLLADRHDNELLQSALIVSPLNGFHTNDPFRNTSDLHPLPPAAEILAPLPLPQTAYPHDAGNNNGDVQVRLHTARAPRMSAQERALRKLCPHNNEGRKL